MRITSQNAKCSFGRTHFLFNLRRIVQTEPQTHMRPKIKEKEIGQAWKFSEMGQTVPMVCAVQGFPAPAFRYHFHPFPFCRAPNKYSPQNEGQGVGPGQKTNRVQPHPASDLRSSGLSCSCIQVAKLAVWWVSEPSTSVAPKLKDQQYTGVKAVAKGGAMLVMSCMVQGFPVPVFRLVLLLKRSNI